MNRKAYKTDITDAQWQILEPLIPPAKPGGHPRTVNMREVVNGIFYVLRTGCGWELLPHDLQGATSAPKARYQESWTCLAPAPNTKLLDNETGRGSKRGEQAYPMYGKKERSY